SSLVVLTFPALQPGGAQLSCDEARRQPQPGALQITSSARSIRYGARYCTWPTGSNTLLATSRNEVTTGERSSLRDSVCVSSTANESLRGTAAVPSGTPLRTDAGASAATGRSSSTRVSQPV